MEFVPIMALGTLAFTFVIFLKNVSAQQWRSAITQVIAWVAGICGVFLMAATDFAGGITVGGTPMDKLGLWSKVFVGILAASLLSALNELKKALDSTDTAVVPDWFEPKAEASAHAHLTVPSQLISQTEIEEARRQVRAAGTSTPAK